MKWRRAVVAASLTCVAGVTGASAASAAWEPLGPGFGLGGLGVGGSSAPAANPNELISTIRDDRNGYTAFTGRGVFTFSAGSYYNRYGLRTAVAVAVPQATSPVSIFAFQCDNSAVVGPTATAPAYQPPAAGWGWGSVGSLGQANAVPPTTYVSVPTITTGQNPQVCLSVTTPSAQPTVTVRLYHNQP
ncbi:MAG: hypothetical protein ACRC35_03890 [Angustibacter sp.]